MSNKYIIMFILVLFITIPAIFIVNNQKQRMSIKELNEWIIAGHTQQFCTVIFPQLADCLTFASSACPVIATKAITDCTNEYVADNKLFSREEAQDKYKEAGACFEHSMHGLLKSQYLVHSEVCERKMD